MAHPLDERYWSDGRYWRWWGYACANDPRIIVPKRPRWMGYTLNFAHKRAGLVLLGMIGLVAAPALACAFLAPEDPVPVSIAVVAGIVILIIICHRAANPKTWDQAGRLERTDDTQEPS